MTHRRKIALFILLSLLLVGLGIGLGPSGFLLDPMAPAWGAAAPSHASTTTSTTSTTTTTTTPPVLDPLPKMNNLEAKALAMVRYPWRAIPNYTIVFAPYSQTPQAGVYGMTTFLWGQPGGKTTIYVAPGETAVQIAGTLAFEIGHQVDAAGVYPGGGHEAIEKLLKIYPKTWAPTTPTSEVNYLSGWYCAAFANRWSPGVGMHWSNLAPRPSGALAKQMEKWLNPTLVPPPPPIQYDL